MDAFRAGSGRYHLESQEHFEDYLKAIGVPEAHIPMAMDAGSHVECEYHADTDDWVVHVQGLRESEYKVKVGVESPPTVTPDGRTVTDTFEFQDNKLVQKEKWDGGEATFIHEINGDKWTMTMMHGNAKCVRHYKREK